MSNKVLIVDDSSVNRYVLESLLKEDGLEVTSAGHGKEALNKARINPPDLIVSDILMPVMDGYALCRQLKSDEALKHIPVVFYTATYTSPKDEKFALSLGVDRFIRKPIEPEQLMSIFREVLDDNQAGKKMMTNPLGEEMEFFRGYNEILFRKLEKKISDLEMANKQLKMSEEKYRLTFENISDVIFMVDTDLTVLSISPSVERILGYKPQDFVGRPVSDLGNILTPESLEQAKTDIGSILKGETISLTVYRFIAKDGAITVGEVSGSPIWQGGRVIGMICVARDITERKKVEEALEESEKQYRELVQYAPAGIYEIDYETGRFTSVNDVICEYTGYTREELLTISLFNLLTEESQKVLSERLEKLVADQEVSGLVEYCIRRKDGDKLWVLLRARYTYQEGRLKSATGVIYNITERKAAENALRANEEFLRNIVENIPNMVFVKDVKDLRFLKVNQAGEALLGYSRQEIIGKKDHDFFPKNQADFFTEKDREVLKKKQLIDIPEEVIQTRQRGERILHTTKIPIMGKEGKVEYLLGISEDVTERKQAAIELKLSLEKLRKAMDGIIQAIALTVEIRDSYTAGHQRRVTDLARAIAREMGLSEDQVEGVRMAGIVHDLGKFGVPAEILSKPTKLSDLEFGLIKIHPQIGYDILKDIEFPWPVAQIVFQHHERLDGSGYPQGLSGGDILLEARILAVADVVEAIASHRPYRPALGIDKALEEISQKKGIIYDPKVVEVCLKLFKEKKYMLG